MKTLNIFAAFVFALSITHLIYGQSADKPNDEQPKKLIKITKRDGWSIPNLENVKAKFEREIEIDSISVTRKLYSIRDREIPIKLESYYLKNYNTLSIDESPYGCEIDRVVSFSVKDKTFAHEISCVIFSVQRGTVVEKSKNNKRRIYTTRSKSYAAAMISSFYYDEDGDGKFETKYDTLKMPSELPKWIKDLATAN